MEIKNLVVTTKDGSVINNVTRPNWCNYFEARVAGTQIYIYPEQVASVTGFPVTKRYTVTTDEGEYDRETYTWIRRPVTEDHEETVKVMPVMADDYPHVDNYESLKFGDVTLYCVKTSGVENDIRVNYTAYMTKDEFLTYMRKCAVKIANWHMADTDEYLAKR